MYRITYIILSFFSFIVGSMFVTHFDRGTTAKEIGVVTSLYIASLIFLFRSIAGRNNYLKVKSKVGISIGVGLVVLSFIPQRFEAIFHPTIALVAFYLSPIVGGTLLIVLAIDIILEFIQYKAFSSDKKSG